MKALFALLALTLAAFGCARQLSRQSSSPGVMEKSARQVLKLPRQTLTFKPDRDDISVGHVTLAVASSAPGEIRLNGDPLDPAWKYIDLKPVGKNQFELPALILEFPADTNFGILCVSVKPWFNEVTTQYDSMLYENVPDRYALVSWCTIPPETFPETSYRARFHQNRVATQKEFIDTLARPFVIRLNQRPLREEWGRYPMLGPGNRLSEADVKAIEEIVRQRGETHLILITANGSDSAQANVGDGTYFRGARSYKLLRKDGKWQIESVEPAKH